MKTGILLLSAWFFSPMGAWASESADFLVEYDTFIPGNEISESEDFRLQSGLNSFENRAIASNFQVIPIGASPQCGNGMVDSGEICDQGAFQGVTCTDYGFDGGNLTCLSCASIETSSCENSNLPEEGSPNTGGGGTRTSERKEQPSEMPLFPEKPVESPEPASPGSTENTPVPPPAVRPPDANIGPEFEHVPGEQDFFPEGRDSSSDSRVQNSSVPRKNPEENVSHDYDFRLPGEAPVFYPSAPEISEISFLESSPVSKLGFLLVVLFISLWLFLLFRKQKHS